MDFFHLCLQAKLLFHNFKLQVLYTRFVLHLDHKRRKYRSILIQASKSSVQTCTKEKISAAFLVIVNYSNKVYSVAILRELRIASL